MPPLHAILASLGTDGDVFPFIGLGVALRARGHCATLVASEDYRALAQSLGLSFRALVSAEENARCFENPDVWHPLKGPIVVSRWGAGMIPRHYELFAGMAAEDPRAVFVGSPGVVALRLVQERLNRPLASVILQPWMIQSCAAPPVMPGGLTLPRWAPRPVGRLYQSAFNATGLLLMGRPLNALRRRLGLPRVTRVFEWWLSPQRAIGMFPDWYGPPQADWPAQLRLCGFPMYDGTIGATATGLLPDLAAFCAAPGGAPVAFTFGTGMRHGGALFRAAAEACRALDVRAIFLTRHGAQLPPGLPRSIRHVPYAPFRALFPRCAAVVHHGGVGTTAKALAAGVPQLILSIAFDQADNADRVKGLNAGAGLPARRATGRALAGALAPLLSSAARANAAAAAARFDDRADTLDDAAGMVEELGAR